MKYRVAKDFRCKLDKKIRRRGDIYETEDPDRAAYLSIKGFLGAMIEGPAPKAPEPENVEEPAPEKPAITHIGGGYYELPNGKRVQGKEAALAALGDE